MAKEFPLSIILRAVDKATGPLRKVGKSLSKVGRDLSTKVSLPILAVGAASVKAFADFERGMTAVSTLIDTSTEDLDAMGRKVLEIGRRTPVAVSDLTAALYDVRSAGISAADQFSVLERSAQLGVAGLGSTKEAVDLVTSSINAFGLTGADAERVYDQIFKTVKNGKTNIAELAQGFGAVASTVNATGTELDEYLAAVAALTTTGLPAAQAHSQLRAVMSGLTRSTEKTRAVFRKLGAKDFKDLIKQSGGLVPALGRVRDLLGGNEGKMFDLFGSTEALGAVLSVTGAQAGAFSATLADMRTGAEAMTVAFDKQGKTATARMQKLSNVLVSLGTSIAKILLPTLEKLASMLEGVADWFIGLDKGTQRWIVGIAVAVAAIGPALAILGKLAMTLSLVTKAFGLVATAVRVVSAVLIANPLGAAVALLATAAYMIYDNWGDFEDFFKLIWGGVVDAFDWAWSKIKPIIDRIMWAVDKAKEAADYFGGGSGDPENAKALLARRAALRPQSRPSLDPAKGPGAGASSTETRVKLDITGAPRGTRAQVDKGSDAGVDLSLGYAMGTP